jgi:hypothetical protein
MKSIVIHFFLLLFAIQSYGQINLVPNPSFEDTILCPTFIGDITPANHWLNFGGSADYFNSCNHDILSVPNTVFGYQFPHTGNAFAGLITYVWQQAPGWPDYREFIGVELIQPLVISQKYYFSFYFNLAGYLPGYQYIAANKIGLKFSTTTFSLNQPPALTNSASFFTDTILKDTLNWVRLSGSFVADSAYSHLILGNFFDAFHTDTAIFGGPPFGGSSAYYFIDDICVTTDSMYNNSWTSIDKVSNDLEVKIFTDPALQLISIRSSSIISEIRIINVLGVICKIDLCNSQSWEIETDFFSNGNYVIQVQTKQGTYSKLINILP